MYSCIIVDDEPLAIDVIKNHIERSALLEIVSSFTSSTKAFTFLQKNPVDVVFIDIQMPGMTGIEIIKTLSRKPVFIITSAYREYALDGYDLEVLDFLVKPISYERFLKSISRFVASAALQIPVTAAAPRFIFIREGKKMTKLFLDSILYLESQKDYIKVVTTEDNFITRGTMSYYEEWLPVKEFARVHRSFVVALSKIKAYTESDIEMIDGVIIPVGDLYRKPFRDLLQKHSL
jgi:DNA-binding LytR/AlgR family response regulator